MKPTSVIASQGSIDEQNHTAIACSMSPSAREARNSTIIIALAVRSHSISPPAPRIALEDNPVSIRKSVWLATDRVYRAASNRLIRIKADEKLRAAGRRRIGRFFGRATTEFFSSPPALKFNSADWAARLRKVSADLAKYPGAHQLRCRCRSPTDHDQFVTSEGTRLESGRLFARLIITARGKASDGMDLSSMESLKPTIRLRFRKTRRFSTLSNAPAKILPTFCTPLLLDPFVGPAILSGRATGVFFHEIFGHRIEGHRQKDESEGQTFTKSVGKPVLPAFPVGHFRSRPASNFRASP